MSDIWNDPPPVYYDDGVRFGSGGEMIEKIKNQSTRMQELEEALALAREHRSNILYLLGYDEQGQGLITVEPYKDRDGESEVKICNDPYYDLEGAVIDLERTGADKVCIRTIKRVQKRLADVANYCGRNGDPAQQSQPSDAKQER